MRTVFALSLPVCVVTFSLLAVASRGDEINLEPLALRPAVAFPKLNWEGWSAESDRRACCSRCDRLW